MRSTGLPPLIVILGPTASGKTSLSLSLAKEYHGVIVSADSRQVYRGLDIGTSKISEKEQKEIPHYLLDFIAPGEEFTLALYQTKAFGAVEEILKNDKIPFLVGGTGLYIDAVVDNFLIPKVAPNQSLRQSLEKKDIRILQKELLAKDKEAVQYVDIKNPRRIIRAIEVMEATRKKWSELRKKGKRKYRVLKLGIDWPREGLYQRSDEVVEQMFQKGLVDEVKEILASGVSQEWLGSLGLEYRAVVQGWDIQKLKFVQHAYIRRQLTWFRRDKEICWIDSKYVLDEAKKLVREFLT